MAVSITFGEASYLEWVDLNDHPDWVTMNGQLLIDNEQIGSGMAGTVGLSRYIGHTFNSNHSSEVTFVINTAGGGGAAHGCAVRLQTGSNSGYYAYMEPGNPGACYLGVVNGGSHTYPFSNSANNENTGAKLRLTVTGVGSATRLTVEHNNGIGGGWMTLLNNVDPGIYFDGGFPGVSGYNDVDAMRIEGVTFTGEIVSGAITGTTSFAFSQSASLSGAAALSGTTTFAFGSTATLAGSGAASGTTTLTFGSTATLSGSMAATGTTTVTFGSTANLSGEGSAGTTTLTFGSTANLAGSMAATGTTTLTFDSSAILSGSVEASGSTTVTFDSSAILSGSLSGTTTLTFTAYELSVAAITGTTTFIFGFDAASAAGWRLVGRSFYYDSNHWLTTQWFLEAEFRAIAGTVRAELRDDTGLAVPESRLSSTSTDFVRARSTPLPMVHGQTYRAYFGFDGPDAEYLGVSLISR